MRSINNKSNIIALYIIVGAEAEPNRLHFTKTKMDACVLTNHMRLI
jgi:hypothetical protein